MTQASQNDVGLPALRLEDWEETKDTLHLYLQEVGKVQLATRSPRSHWWHVTLALTARGLLTGRIPGARAHFDIEADFIDHRVVVRTDRGDVEEIELLDGLAVADFHEWLMGTLERLGVRPHIKAEPFGLPMKTPFAEDREHSSYQADYVERFWHILGWTADTLEDFASRFCGKQSPVQLFWHSFDLAQARFSGRRAPERPNVDPVSQEAYSHEIISCGFWAGSQDIREPAFYSYTAPEPRGLVAEQLDPAAAEWVEAGSGHLALLRYEDLREAEEPRSALTSFFQSAYMAGARAANWPYEELDSSWHPAGLSTDR